MTVQLNRFEDVLKLRYQNSLSWICCECLTLNVPPVVTCTRCQKRRWLSLGLSLPVAKALAEVIRCRR